MCNISTRNTYDWVADCLHAGLWRKCCPQRKAVYGKSFVASTLEGAARVEACLSTELRRTYTFSGVANFKVVPFSTALSSSSFIRAGQKGTKCSDNCPKLHCNALKQKQNKTISLKQNIVLWLFCFSFILHVTTALD